MIYLTADPHGKFEYISDFCKERKTNRNDLLIILGDTELNLDLNFRDNDKKSFLSNLPLTYLCLHGNHEIRVEHISSYDSISLFDGIVFFERNYPNIFFAKDAERYIINGYSFLVIGGAYSPTRLIENYHDNRFWDDEQPSIMCKKIVNDLCDNHYYVDFVLSHTCPVSYIPYESCTLPINQSLVDRTTEIWLQSVYDRLGFRAWYCGHYHTQKVVDRVHFLANEIVELK